jgi:hypothetical protein
VNQLEVPIWLRILAPEPARLAPGATVEGMETLAMGVSVGADFIVVEDKATDEIKRLVGKSSCPVVDLSEVLRQAEVFARGHEIPWSFNTPIWNMPWSNFHTMLDDFGRQGYMYYMNRVRSLKIDEATLENIRSLLLNRVANVCYTRDKLAFICQQRAIAQRRGWKRQRFVFEAAYFLNHYYHLLWGGTEQLARVIDSLLNLEVSNKIQISLGNPKFTGKIIAANPQVGRLYSESWFTDWIGKLKTCRDHIAHAGTSVLSPLAREPETTPTDEELDSEVQQSEEFRAIQRFIPPHLRSDYIAMLRENLRVSKLSIIRDDAWIIVEAGKKSILFPLNDIDWHYDNYRKVLLRTLDALLESME